MKEDAMTHRILVIDDESHILHVLSLKLGKAGYEVLTAVDGEEGLHLAKESGPDLVITDIQMPYMTGIELSRALADDETTAGIPVIILTARGYALSSDDLQIQNVREVLSKPFSPRSLIELVSATLQSNDERSAAA